MSRTAGRSRAGAGHGNPVTGEGGMESVSSVSGTCPGFSRRTGSRSTSSDLTMNPLLGSVLLKSSREDLSHKQDDCQ